MKIRCDVCDKDEASVFCVADEAALCDACDHRVHHANKLAGKHQRFSLLLPSPKDVPLCDVCQERRAFLFCQQDRAILCRECDIPLHKANEHTQKHNRFLLTGVKLSAKSSLYTSNSITEATASSRSASTNSSEVVSQTSKTKPIIAVDQSFTSNNLTAKAGNTTNGTAPMTITDKDISFMLNGQMLMNGGANGPISNVSDNLIEMLPSWQVDDFLDPSSAFGFCKSDGMMSPLWDADLEGNLSSFSPTSTGAPWVPQATTPLHPAQFHSSFSTLGMPRSFGDQISFKETKDISTFKPSRKWKDDNSYAVPQINPPSSASNKRSRALW